MESYIVEKDWTLLASVRHSLKHDSTSTSRLASDSNLGRISAKPSDVRLNPSKGETLIQKTGIQLTISLNVFGREKAKCAKSILDLDRNEAISIRVY